MAMLTEIYIEALLEQVAPPDIEALLEQVAPPDPELVDLLEKAFLEEQLDGQAMELAYLWVLGCQIGEVTNRN
jgi:hypothetical protein